MICFDYTIQDKIGLHARPIGMIAKAIAPYADTQVTISSRDQSADAKRIFAMMSLQARQGDTISIQIEGGEESLVADAIRQVFVTENL